MSDQPSIGSIRVLLYAGLDGETPIEVGSVMIPIRLDPMRTKGIEGSLREAVEYVAADLQAVFGTERDS